MFRTESGHCMFLQSADKDQIFKYNDNFSCRFYLVRQDDITYCKGFSVFVITLTFFVHFASRKRAKTM